MWSSSPPSSPHLWIERSWHELAPKEASCRLRGLVNSGSSHVGELFALCKCLARTAQVDRMGQITRWWAGLERGSGLKSQVSRARTARWRTNVSKTTVSSVQQRTIKGDALTWSMASPRSLKTAHLGCFRPEMLNRSIGSSRLCDSHSRVLYPGDDPRQQSDGFSPSHRYQIGVARDESPEKQPRHA